MHKNNTRLVIFTIINILSLITIFPRYTFLIWNLFLAFIPFFMIYLSKKKKLKYISYIVWLIFYPNAIYLLTDYIHLSRFKYYTVSDIVVYNMNIDRWLALYFITIFTLLGLILGYISLKEMNKHLSKYIYYPIISILTGIAVYIGRFVRLNSWELFTSPIDTFNTIISNINGETIEYIGLFSVLHLFITYIFDILTAYRGEKC